MATTLIVLGKVWLWIAGALILLGYASIWWFDGLDKLLEILNPFNVWTFIAVILTLAPGVFLLNLGEHLRERRPAAER
jgi:hypothetical protein